MKHIKLLVTTVLLIALTLLTVSCGTPKETKESTAPESSSEETAKSNQYKTLDVNDYFISVGRLNSRTRLMHITETGFEYVWWEQDEDKYCPGDVYYLRDEVKPQIAARKYYEGSWEKDVYGNYAEFDKLGTCKELLTIKTLKVIYTEEDQMEGMVRFKDTEPVFDGEDGEYTFRYMNYDVLDAHVSRAKPGDLYIFVFPRKDIMVPLERMEKESELEKWKEIFFGSDSDY